MFVSKEEVNKWLHEVKVEKCTTNQITIDTCSLDKWEISEENRKFILNPLWDDAYCFVNNDKLNELYKNAEKEYKLQVISDLAKPSKISVDFTGTCKTDAKKCITMQVVNADIGKGGHEQGIQEKNEKFSFDALYFDSFEDEDFIQILKNRLFPEAILKNPKSTYNFHVYNCFLDFLKNKKKVSIEVFPKYELKGELSISYGRGYTTEKFKRKGRYNNEKIDVVDSLWKLDGKIDYLYGKTHLIFEGGISTGEDQDNNRTSQKIKRKKVKELFQGIQKNVNKFHKFFEDANSSYKNKSEFQTLKFEPGLTNFTFKADSKLVEINDQNNVGFESNIEISISIFKDSKITLDIIQFLLAKGSSDISKLISKAREAAKKGYDGKYVAGKAELILELRIGGGIDGVLKWTRKAKDNKYLTEGSISGSVSIQLEGKIHAEGKVFFVKATVGAYVKNASTKSENEPTKIIASLFAKEADSGDMEVGGKLEFNGLTIYYASYAEVGVEVNESIDEDESRGKTSLKQEFKAEGNLPLLKPWDSNQESKKVDKFVN